LAKTMLTTRTNAILLWRWDANKWSSAYWLLQENNSGDNLHD